jgi:hypothetical protein
VAAGAASEQALLLKRFEHLLVRENLTNVVIRGSYFARASVAVVMAVGWFVISNHCALAAFETGNFAPAHAHCHGSTAPSKSPSKDEQQPCCKVVRAILAKGGGSVAENALTFYLQQYFVGLVVFPEQLHWPQSFELDTGPPFSGSFAESVLQRSILAHAPPSSLG